MGGSHAGADVSAVGARAEPNESPPERDRRGLLLDVGIAVALAVIAVVIRRTGLPDNGLWHDDAWVAAGAIHGSPLEIFMVGSGHPGFVGGLMAVSRFTGGSSDAMAWPALVAGVLGPPLVYFALRRFAIARSIAGLCAAALVVADIHILYSTRVKTYAVDLLIVLGLVVLLPRLARVTWTWTTALGWFVFSVAIAFFSGFGLVAAAMAGLFLVVYAQNDRRWRLVAVGAQAVAELLMYRQMRASTDLARIERQQEPFYDGHMSFSWNPFEFLGELHDHFRRVVNVYPGGPSWLLTVLVVMVVVGLTLAALQRRRSAEAMRAQYLSSLLVFAIVGATLAMFPFGPTSPASSVHSRGERSTLWLVPVLAVGFALALQYIRRSLRSSRAARIGFDVLVVLLALGVVAASVDERAASYAFSGAKEVAQRIEGDLRAGDVVLLPSTSTYPYTVETDAEVKLRATPERAVGYIPLFTDQAIVAVGAFGSRPIEPDAIGEIVEDAERVIVYYHLAFFGPNAEQMGAALTEAGFEPVGEATVVDDAQLIQTWLPRNA